MSSFVAGVGNGVLELGQQRLEADPQLQRRLALAAGVEVGTGAQQQGLAGVDLFAAAEHRRHPFLRAQVFFARRRRREAPLAQTSTSRAAVKRLAAGSSPLP